MSAPSWLTGFIDDAAIFPPGNLALDRAVTEHLEHRGSEYADLVGGFVVSDLKIPDLIDVLDDLSPTDGAEEQKLAINLVVTGGAGALEPAVRWALRSQLLSLRAVEVALRNEEDLAHNAQRFLTVLDVLEEELDGVHVYVEPPRLLGEPGHGWLAALDELSLHEVRAKFRTGGVDADAFPTPAELAASIDAALDRELPFKCTAGLHHAVRGTDPETGLTQHGFLNVLLATRACLDGADAEAVLAEQSADALLAGFDADEAARTRRWFTGFGSCSVLEPHHDLVELGLLDSVETGR